MKNTKQLNLFFTSFFLVLSTTSVIAQDSYYHNTLFKPSDSIIKAESNGRIMIYDGLNNETVDKAMDEQFDRIDNMMFTRIHYSQDNGEEYVDDDGCD